MAEKLKFPSKRNAGAAAMLKENSRHRSRLVLTRLVALQFARDIAAKMNLLLTRAPRESLLQSGERLYAFGEIDSLIRAVTAEGLPVSQSVPEPVVLAWVRVAGPDIPAAYQLSPDQLLTGAEVHARIRCGNRAMGYSLFYGVWEFAYEKIVFLF